MTEYVSRAQALTVNCPNCGAAADEPCHGTRDQIRASVHHERMNAAMRRREPRFYDLDQTYVPYTDTPPAREPTRIADDDRVRGLAHCHQILEQLAARGLATGKGTNP